MIIKPLAQEVNLASATDVDSATLVRLLNTGTATLVTVADGATTVATFTINQNEVVAVQKEPTHTLAAVTAVKAVKVGFTN